MKARDTPKFRLWLETLCVMDKRLNGADFNKLRRLWLRSNK